MKLKVSSIPASLWRRALAYIIDIFVIQIVIIFPFQKVLKELGGDFAEKGVFQTYSYILSNPDYMQAILPKLFMIFAVVSTLSVLYWSILEFKIGQSVGKILLNIYVKSQKKELTFGQCFLRSVTKISTFPLILDTLYLLLSRGNQRFFEKISKTFVVEQRYSL